MQVTRSDRPSLRVFKRDTRGASITEYAIILFIVAVVCAVSFKFLGQKLGGGFGSVSHNLEGQGQQPPPAGGEAAAAAGANGGSGVTNSKHSADDGNTGFGGARQAASKEAEGPSSLSKFAMIALGVIGAGAAFFAIMKGKTAR